MTVAATPRTRFDLPPDRSAAEPPEERGLARDGVRLLVADGQGEQHATFRDLGRFLAPGDLLVVNTSKTTAAAVDGVRATGHRVTVHFSTRLEDGSHVVELRSQDGRARVLDGATGEVVTLPRGATLRLRAPWPQPDRPGPVRLWRADVGVEGPVAGYLRRVARPISYGYLRGRWPLASYQTVFARDDGSAEMPSAGRPFSPELVTSLVGDGVLIAPVTLHTGVSSLEAGETPYPEWFRVPPTTAALVPWVRGNGGRVVAVGTTVTRALESVARSDGAVEAAEGWTGLVLGPDRPARVVDGIVTGLHAPDASHLQLLEAVAGAAVVRRAYRAAVRAGYLWHEFGDSCLLLRDRPGTA
ncbi:MAG: S-adenosylmethionine:tRNA ribosyltransferase-isomerase [Actinomycetes bacterium]